MSKDFNAFYRCVNDFIAEAAADGDLNHTFHDFGDQNPDEHPDFQYLLAIIVNSHGEPRIDTDANSHRGDVLVGWPCIEPFTDMPDDVGPNSEELLEQRKREFKQECKDLIRAIRKQPENAIELCQLDFALDKAWFKLLES